MLHILARLVLLIAERQNQMSANFDALVVSVNANAEAVAKAKAKIAALTARVAELEAAPPVSDGVDAALPAETALLDAATADLNAASS